MSGESPSVTGGRSNQEGVVLAPQDDGTALAREFAGRQSGERTVANLRLFWEQRRFLFSVAAYGLLAATLLTFLIPKRYESTTRLMPPDNQAGMGMTMLASLATQSSSGLGAMVGDLLSVKSSGALFVGILQSRTVQDRLITRFDLRKVYGTRRWDDARKQLSQNTDISEDPKTGIITITVTDHGPYRAAAIAQAYVEELNRLVAELTTSAAHRERVFLEERLQTVKQDLESAEKDFSEFASQNTAIDIKEQGRAMVEAAATLQGQLIAAQSELEGLLQVYTENNVRVRTVRARIGELQRQLDKLGGAGENPTTGDPPERTPLYPSIRKLPLLGVPYADLFRRTKVQEAVFETLTQEYELAKVEEAKEIPSVKVLDPANVPEKQSFPPRLVIMLLGTILAMSFGAVWVFGNALWEHTDQRDPRKVLALEIYQATKAHLHRGTQDGFGVRAASIWVWSRLYGRHKSLDKQG
jgi:uncharacterized protein involved in exopolysaccharide biosynthesis